MNKRVVNWRAGRSALGILALTLGVMGISTSVAGAIPKSHAGIPNYTNKLSSSTKGWCPVTSPPNAPCDGAVNDYGTIDIVKSSFSNNGGYAPSVPGPNGQKKYARASGAPSNPPPGVSETPNGCTIPGSENCTGPYTKFGSTVHHAVFPTKGFTTSIKLYLDSGWANANPGQVIDWDVSLRNSSGDFMQDNAFNLCSTSNAGGGFYLSTSYGAGGGSTGPTELSVSGWYTFNLTFTSVGGFVQDAYSVLNSAASSVFSQTVNTGNATSGVGGPDYGWLPDEDVLGLPIAQVRLHVN